MRTTYAWLDADPEELAGAVDVDTLLAAICTELGHVPEITLAPLLTDHVRLRVMPGSDIESVAQACGTTTGLPGACKAAALFVPPRTILVVRLDWPRLLAHELTHLVQRLTGRPFDEREADRVAEAVA